MTISLINYDFLSNAKEETNLFFLLGFRVNAALPTMIIMPSYSSSSTPIINIITHFLVATAYSLLIYTSLSFYLILSIIPHFVNDIHFIKDIIFSKHSLVFDLSTSTSLLGCSRVITTNFTPFSSRFIVVGNQLYGQLDLLPSARVSFFLTTFVCHCCC